MPFRDLSLAVLRLTPHCFKFGEVLTGGLVCTCSRSPPMVSCFLITVKLQKSPLASHATPELGEYFLRKMALHLEVL